MVCLKPNNVQTMKGYFCVYVYVSYCSIIFNLQLNSYIYIISVQNLYDANINLYTSTPSHFSIDVIKNLI